MKHTFSLMILCLALLHGSTACNDKNRCVEEETPDSTSLNWEDKGLWFEGDIRLGNTDEALPDVFYLLPTCITAWDDEDGNKHYNADPSNPTHRQAWQLSAELADTIFATHANLYLPYYRQATFDALQGDHAEEACRMATHDALEAFNYYLTHHNHNRPFILAGYSQGGMLVKNILKSMDDDTYQRLIAAYVVGYGITAADTVTQPGHRTSHVKLAHDSTSLGVTINFNSVTNANAICPLVCNGNIACINPVSWTTDSTPAVLLAPGKSPKTDDARFPYGTAAVAQDGNQAVTVSVDPGQQVLIVGGVDPQRYFLPSLQGFFSLGNLHLQELFFYADHLRHNVLLRSEISKNK